MASFGRLPRAKKVTKMRVKKHQDEHRKVERVKKHGNSHYTKVSTRIR